MPLYMHLLLFRLVVFLAVLLVAVDSLSTPAMTPAAAAAAAAGSARLSVRIVSYNVLSSHLASPDHFTACKPEDLEFTNRLPRVLSKLEAQIKDCRAKEKPVIFCLQEVSHSFAGPLHTFFANNRYTMITGLYGKPFNNYMGIALAYPIDAYETIAAEQVRLSDCRSQGWPREPRVEAESISGKLANVKQSLRKFSQGSLRRGIRSIVGPVRHLLRLPPPPKDPIDPWHMSQNRQNILVSVCLKERVAAGDGQTFCLSNYHMPCAFYAPPVMNIHADLAAKHCQDFAASAGPCPHILAGDFNLMPESAHYKMLTTGVLPRFDPTYPAEKYGVAWQPEAKPMQSAYAVSSHGEPDYTNYAKIRDDEPFIGTLDYIFLSNEWDVDDVQKISTREEYPGPFPKDAEPSDHLLISADLSLSGSIK
jgi:2',5'-phosphodiesterase